MALCQTNGVKIMEIGKQLVEFVYQTTYTQMDKGKQNVLSENGPGLNSTSPESNKINCRGEYFIKIIEEFIL